jgi:hypothetical protein
VVNLDGKVNGDALSALRHGDMGDYIRKAGIDVVIDHESVLNLFLGPCGEGDLGGMLATRCFNGSQVGALGWVGFRVRESTSGAGASLSAPGDQTPGTTRQPHTGTGIRIGSFD